jgi:cell division protein FtsL
VTPNDYRRQKKFKPGRFIIIFVLFVVAFGILMSSHSFMKIYKLKQINEQVSKSRDEAFKEKRKLLMEINRLTSDSTYIEEIARKEYGMVKKGEEVFQIALPETTGTGKNAR